MAAAGTNVFGKLQCFIHKLRFWGQFSGLEHKFGDYEMIVINPLCFKPLYPNNNYHLATVSWVNSMQVICMSLRKPPLQRIAHSPVYRIGKPGRCWPAFSNWLWWLSCIAPQLPPTPPPLLSHTFCRWNTANQVSEWANRRPKLTGGTGGTVIPTFLSSFSSSSSPRPPSLWFIKERL